MSVFPAESTSLQSDDSKYEGIRGWLLLIVLGLCISPFLQAFFIFSNLNAVLQPGVWQALTTPGSEAYHRLWAPVIIFEILMNVFFIGFEISLLFLLFRKSRLFPKSMIVYLLTVFALIALDYAASRAIPAVAAQDDPESRRVFVRAGISCAIWIPYLLKSKRVRVTFVR